MSDTGNSMARSGRIVPDHVRKASARTDRPNKKSEGAGYGTGLLTGLFVMILLAALSVGAMMFNVAGLKDQAIQLLGLEKDARAILEISQQEIEEGKTRLAAKEQELAQLEQSLASRESTLASKEKQLSDQLDQLNAAREDQNAQMANLADLVILYEAMDQAKLAEILSTSQSLDDHLPVLAEMNKNKLSQVLTEMKASDAENILKALTAGSVQ